MKYSYVVLMKALPILFSVQFAMEPPYATRAQQQLADSHATYTVQSRNVSWVLSVLQTCSKLNAFRTISVWSSGPIN